MLTIIWWGNCKINLKQISTFCGQVTPYGGKDWVIIGLGNGLQPDVTKALPDPILSNHHRGLVGNVAETLMIYVLDMSLTIANSRVKPHLPGASGLIQCITDTHDNTFYAINWRNLQTNRDSDAVVWFLYRCISWIIKLNSYYVVVWCIIMMVADDLAPIWGQGIWNHHDDEVLWWRLMSIPS